MDGYSIFTHIGAINADKSLFRVAEMRSQVRNGLLTFCSAPGVLKSPDLLTITEVPSLPQAEALVLLSRQTLNAPYNCEIKKVQNNDFTLLLWDVRRFTPTIKQPKTHSTRFLPKALQCNVTGRVHLCAAVHRERGQHPRTFEAMLRSFDGYEEHDHVHVFGDLNARNDLLCRYFPQTSFNIGIVDDIVTTQAGRQCDNVIWDDNLAFDSADVLINPFCGLTHYPIQSFSYMGDFKC
eukprot:gene4063-4444_t